MKSILILALCCATFSYGQSYDYYSIGDTSDVQTNPSFGICLMGGATEDDNGSSWFLEKADGGNIVVIRASGSDGYNEYFYNQLGVTVQSVETIVFNTASASQDPFIQRRLSNAEAIWIAGGDQFIYESYWRNTAIEDILNDHISSNYPIGGTSAGMAILSEYYFNAENGTVTSTQALNDPLSSAVSVEKDFILNPLLSNTINDTHYDNPDRRGRHAAFLAHLLNDNNSINFGIGAEEYVAICIEPTGIATVFGQYPTYEDHAYFLRTNCSAEPPGILQQNTPLTWETTSDAISVCKVEARSDGSSQFDLNEWKDLNHGSWEGWNINAGSLTVTNSTYESCNLSTNSIVSTQKVIVYPNPSSDYIEISSDKNISKIEIQSIEGQIVDQLKEVNHFNTQDLRTGTYILSIYFSDGTLTKERIVIDH
tara:strand:- start:37562 stop:38836 length:1275 start_codon:yes stop_codon:yes gene_type:complete